MNKDNNKFLLPKYIKDFIMTLDDYLINYPRKYYELRNRLVNDSYNLLELVYTANYMDIKERKPIQIEAMMRVNLIDFYLEHSFKYKIISEKQSARLSKKLLDINKMLYKWIKNEECKD